MSNHRDDDDEDFASLLAEFEIERKDPKIGEKIQGTIVTIGPEVAFVDLGAKAEGTVSRAELLDDDECLVLGAGDKIEAMVAAIDPSGNFVLRFRPGRGESQLSELRLAWEQKLPVEGTVTSEVKGGVEVTVGGVRAFCPVSQLDNRYVEDAGVFVGQKLEFRIRTFEGGSSKDGSSKDGSSENKSRRLNVVLSRRVILIEEAERRAAAIREKLTVGSIHDGTVTTIASYGAFVDLGGIEGLLHVSEMSYRRDADPREMLREGQKIQVQILKIEPPKKEGQQDRFSLSTKTFQRDPWEDAPRRYPPGTEVAGQVMRLEPYGAFVELEPGLEGLAHISRLGGKGNERHAREILELGQALPVRVLSIDLEKRRIALAREADEQTKEEQREVRDYLRSGQDSGSGGFGTGGFGSLGDFFKKDS